MLAMGAMRSPGPLHHSERHQTTMKLMRKRRKRFFRLTEPIPSHLGILR